ncbi:FkbM family methyltransferase [Xanthobacter oligotrophicus]|uniref:FkbM family methyltransferase n=1 Tax=Xanthobacter oligotrophicus TaxID=2607286 RepID=UPI0011F16E65|nr:FkbM family methyltransferase [Xanthobacter oligotrophicus]MCG5235026.1 FkbM family methyltransferase [Xanthobacter oligotrophicus]
MLKSLKAILERRMPRVFALLCPLVDARAAHDPDSEVRLLPLLVAPGDTVCDIGANRGLFTYWLLRHGARVLAFEPNPSLVRILKLRFPGEIRSGALTLFETALSADAGAAVLHIPRDLSPLATLDGDLAAGPTEDVHVPMARLDACVTADVSFIKLDVEGHEVKVLQGARGLVAASRPTFLIEAEERHRPGAVAAVRQVLDPFGYRGFFRLGQKMRPIAEFDPAVHQSVAALEPDGTRPRKGALYVNDFYFAARPDIIARLERWQG